MIASGCWSDAIICWKIFMTSRVDEIVHRATSSTSSPSARDPIHANCELIEVHVSELKQLFNAIDPSPFRERDLDPNAEAFIADWAKEAPLSASLGLTVYLDRPAGLPNESAELQEAIHEFFRHRATLSRRRLRELFRRGRTSLAIGVCALGVSVAAGNLVERFISNHVAKILNEGLLIGGWVAMWRPMEIFLYDWWPIRAKAMLADRLTVMPVRISYKKQDGSDDAWRWDWPAASPATRAVHSEPTESSAGSPSLNGTPSQGG
jgi:hypothetical protein